MSRTVGIPKDALNDSRAGIISLIKLKTPMFVRNLFCTQLTWE